MRSIIVVLCVLSSIIVSAGDKPLIEHVDFGAYSCAGCRTPEVKKAKQTVINNLRRETVARGMDFRSVCVIIDTNEPSERVVFGGDNKTLAGATLARATAEEAARQDEQRMGFCVQISDDVLIHAQRGDAREPFEATDEYEAILADELKSREGSSICISYIEGAGGYGRVTDVEQGLRFSSEVKRCKSARLIER